MKRLLALVILALWIPSCAPYVAYKMGQAVDAQQDMMQAQKEMLQRQSYQHYCQGLRLTNFQREKAGLKPEPILSFAEWKVQ